MRASKDPRKRFEPYWLFGSAFLAALIIAASMVIRPLWWFSWFNFGVGDIVVLVVLWLLITYAVYRKGFGNEEKR